MLIRTLRTLMTPFLPPFYRVFMGGVVPDAREPDRGRTSRPADPQWLADTSRAREGSLLGVGS